MSRTRPTRAERLRHNTAAGLFLIGAALSWSIGGGAAGWLAGHGWHPALAWPSLEGFGGMIRAEPGASLLATRLPDASLWLWIPCSALLGLAMLRWVVVPLLRPGADPRARGLAQWPQVRRLLSARAVRRSGRFTRPDLSPRDRRRVPLTELGYRMGTMRGRREPLWASFETRVRIIARTGWGKTSRLLVWIARDLPGAALIGTTSPDLFEQTIRVRQARGQVLVVDFSEREHRIAEGFAQVRWNPIRGCEDYQLAQRRARALVAGAEDGDRSDNNDGFFRDSAGHVIAAWLHAAALGRKDIRDVIHWQRNIKLPDPADILERHPYAEKAARLALLKHLDDRAERTTSSVERFIVLALAPFATRDGEAFAIGGESVDIAQLIRDRATIYLLASDTTAAAVSPLLTMFADEWFHTARAVGMTHKETGGRLPVPAVGLLDELRRLVPIPSLPAVAAEFRKYGVGLVYALQNQAQEVELYKEAAKSLAQNVQLTVLGGYDEGLVDEIKEQAGMIDVPSPSVSGSLLEAPGYSEGTHWREVLSGADLQQLADGEAVMRLAGLRPFYGSFRSFRDDRRLRRRITAEEHSVRLEVTGAQATAAAAQGSALAAAQATYDRPRTTL